MTDKSAENSNMKFSFDDKDLWQAALVLQEAFAEIQPTPVDLEHKFSERFSEKINAIAGRQKKLFTARRVMKNIAAAILAVLIGGGLWLGTDAQAQAEFKAWLRTEYEDSILYEFFGKREGDRISGVDVGWLPEGYAETKKLIRERFGYYLFTNGSGEDIFFYYTYMDSDTALGILSDRSPYEKIRVNRAPADFYMGMDEGEGNVLCWFDEEKGIAFELNAALEKQELVKIAESVAVRFG